MDHVYQRRSLCYSARMINDSELLFIVDEDNKPLSPKQRYEVHEKGYWHRCSQVYVINSHQQILCQKRTQMVDMYPGMWDAKFGGHLRPGEEYVDNALVELKEELGLRKEKEDLQFFEVYKSEKDREFQAIFYTRLDGDEADIHLEKEEVDHVEWKDIEELEKVFRNHDPEWVQVGYELRLFVHLKQRLPLTS